ncbi:MAG: hypothetical protein EBQ99_08450, partial [Planctomycetes bacterium]|nr:hypothetical protein [Planctomycetota bacterium]
MPREPSDIPRADWVLATADGVGPVEGRRLLEALGSADAVVGAARSDLAAVLGDAAASRVHAALQA